MLGSFRPPSDRVRGALAAAFLSIALPATALAADDAVGAADRNSGWYLAGKGGPVFGFATGIRNEGGQALNDEDAVNMVGGFGMAGGYTWARQGLPLRTELELMNRTEISYNASPLFSSSSSNDAVGSDIQNVTLMAKGYYHFDAGNPMWSPFIMGGLGLSRTAVSGQYTPAGGTPADLDHVTYGLAWTAGIGASFFLGNRVVNDIELSYVDLGDVDWGRPAATNLRTDSLGAAQIIFTLRYNF